MVQVLRDSIANKGDQLDIKTMTTSQEILKYIKMKYLQNGSLVEGTLNTIQQMKEPKHIYEAITNIERALTIFIAIANAKLNQKVEKMHIAVVQAKTILQFRKQLYQQHMCKVLNKSRDPDPESIVGAVEQGEQVENPRELHP